MRDGGRVAKGYHCRRPGPLSAEVHLPLTAGDGDNRHFPLFLPKPSWPTPKKLVARHLRMCLLKKSSGNQDKSKSENCFINPRSRLPACFDSLASGLGWRSPARGGPLPCVPPVPPPGPTRDPAPQHPQQNLPPPSFARPILGCVHVDAAPIWNEEGTRLACRVVLGPSQPAERDPFTSCGVPSECPLSRNFSLFLAIQPPLKYPQHQHRNLGQFKQRL